MTSWIRSRALPVFFAINLFPLLLAIPVAESISALALHDRIVWPSVTEAITMPVVFATIATIGESRRRRHEKAAR
jgi:hypothetical protein